MQLRNAAEKQIYSGDKAVSGSGTTSPARKIAAQVVKLGSVGAGGSVGGPVGAITGSVIGDQIGGLIDRPSMTRDALIEKAFKNTKTGLGPSYPSVPAPSEIRGALNAPATPMGASPDTSYVTVTTGPPLQPKIRGMLNPPARAMGPGPDASGPTRLSNAAQSMVVRDPKTGRFKRVFTSEVKK